MQLLKAEGGTWEKREAKGHLSGFYFAPFARDNYYTSMQLKILKIKNFAVVQKKYFNFYHFFH